MFIGLDHVAIICPTSGYGRSKAFYTETLGLKVLSEVYRSERDSFQLMLALADGTKIELFSFPNPPKRPSYPEACGLRHLAFAVDDVRAVSARLRVLGVKVEPARLDERTGKEFAFFSDPDGQPLELYEA